MGLGAVPIRWHADPHEVAVVPLAGVGRIYAMKDTVQGFEPHPSGTNQRWSTVFRTE